MTAIGGVIRRRALAWARRRQGVDPSAIVLQSRRLYILPTGQGVAFALMVLVMTVGAMNYNNNLGLAIAFGLVGFGLVCMHHCHRSLLGLRLRIAAAEPVFAGEVARFPITVENPGNFPRSDLALSCGGVVQVRFDVPARSTVTVHVSMPTRERGRCRLDRFGLSSRYPAGLFRTWCWVYADLAGVVWPRPAPADIAGPPEGPAHEGNQDPRRAGDADFAGLREYRHGDSARHIAWKVAARNDELRVREYRGASTAAVWIDLADAAGDTESRLSILTRWVLDAETRRSTFALRLGDTIIEPGFGRGQRDRALTALADY